MSPVRQQSDSSGPQSWKVTITRLVNGEMRQSTVSNLTQEQADAKEASAWKESNVANVTVESE